MKTLRELVWTLSWTVGFVKAPWVILTCSAAEEPWSHRPEHQLIAHLARTVSFHLIGFVSQVLVTQANTH